MAEEQHEQNNSEKDADINVEQKTIPTVVLTKEDKTSIKLDREVSIPPGILKQPPSYDRALKDIDEKSSKR